MTIRYNANGGNKAPKEIELPKKGPYEDILIPSDKPTRTGYKFIGWEYDNKLYSPGDILTPTNEDIELVAKWEVNTYPITYLYGIEDVADETQLKEYGKDITIKCASNNKIVKEHYEDIVVDNQVVGKRKVITTFTFCEWDAGDEIFYPGDTYSKNKKLTLLAMWDKQEKIEDDLSKEEIIDYASIPILSQSEVVFENDHIIFFAKDACISYAPKYYYACSDEATGKKMWSGVIPMHFDRRGRCELDCQIDDTKKYLHIGVKVDANNKSYIRFYKKEIEEIV